MYLLGIACLVVATAALPCLRDQATLPCLPNSKAADHHSKMRTCIQGSTLEEPQDSEGFADIPCVSTDIAQGPLEDHRENKHELVKIDPVVIPPPPELPPFDFAVLKKQMHESNDALRKEAHNCKKEKASVILKDSVKTEVQPHANTLPCSLPEPQESDGRANIPCVSTDITQDPLEDHRENKHELVKIDPVVIPPPPELPPFDFAVLKKQMHESNDALRKEAHNCKKEKASVILKDSFKTEVQPHANTLPCSLPEPQESDGRANIPCVSTDITQDPLEDHRENKHELVKIDPVVIPPPPELPPFDFAVLKKQIHESNDALKKEARNCKKGKGLILENCANSESDQIDHHCHDAC